MAKANLTADRLRELLDYEPGTGLFKNRTKRGPAMSGAVAGCVMNTGYIFIGVDGGRHLAHRLAWLYIHGRWPAAQIDHVNGQRNDNRIANLRELSNQANSQNIRAARKGKTYESPLGACYQPRYKLKWHARIRVGGKVRLLGRYETADEASAAYLEAKRRLHEGCTI